MLVKMWLQRRQWQGEHQYVVCHWTLWWLDRPHCEITCNGLLVQWCTSTEFPFSTGYAYLYSKYLNRERILSGTRYQYLTSVFPVCCILCCEKGKGKRGPEIPKQFRSRVWATGSVALLLFVDRRGPPTRPYMYDSESWTPNPRHDIKHASAHCPFSFVTQQYIDLSGKRRFVISSASERWTETWW